MFIFLFVLVSLPFDALGAKAAYDYFNPPQTHMIPTQSYEPPDEGE